MHPPLGVLGVKLNLAVVCLHAVYLQTEGSTGLSLPFWDCRLPISGDGNRGAFVSRQD